MHALIVDDSKTARYALRQLLDKQKVSADMVESAEEALDYLHQKALSDSAPDLIFMDHMMPGMDGFEAVKELKSSPTTAHIPIVMYTSTQGGMYFGQARALGAVDVINKPATAEDLREVLRRLQEQSRSGVARVAAPAVSEDAAPVTEPVVPETEEAALYVEADNPARVSRAGYWLAAVLLLPLLYFGAQYFDLARANAVLAQQRAAALKAVEWSFNQSTEFAYGETPFNEQRMRLLQDLLTQLHDIGFRGRLVLESHVGVFCLQRLEAAGRPTTLLPASADIPLTECSELGQGTDPRQVALAQTPEFRRFMQESPLLGDAIHVEVRSRGAEAPLLEYPADKHALAWNVVAQRNQRIQIVLEPEAH